MSCTHSFPPVLLESGNVVLDWPAVALNCIPFSGKQQHVGPEWLLIQNNHVNLCLVLDSTTLLIVFQSNILPGQCSSVVAFLPSQFKINVIMDNTLLNSICACKMTSNFSADAMWVCNDVLFKRTGFKLFNFLSMFLSIWIYMTIMKHLMSIHLNKGGGLEAFNLFLELYTLRKKGSVGFPYRVLDSI